MSTVLQALCTLGFLLLCTSLLALPFVPAVREWLQPTDLDSLTVPAHYSSQGDWFASEMRGDAAALAAAGGHPALQPPAAGAKHARVLTESARFSEAVYSKTDLRAAPESRFTALMSAGSLDVGTGSLISEWAHADGVLRLHGSSVSLRRLSAHDRIALERGCCFERLHAPQIEFGDPFPPAARPPAGATAQASYRSLANATRRSAVLHRVDGDCELAPRSHYVGCLVVSGHLTVGRGTVVDGDLQASNGIRLSEGCVVNGAVISERQVEILADATAMGPVTSESEIAIAAGVRIGTRRIPTTLSAPVIVVESGTIAHGTVWARKVGTVWGMA